jgi:hypothetical protein
VCDSRSHLSWGALLVSGCGGAHAHSNLKPATHEQNEVCKVGAPGYRTCGPRWIDVPGGRPSIEHLTDDGWVVVAGAIGFRSPDGVWPGQWLSATPSPDGKTLLAEWSGECGAPTAFFVPTSGESPDPVIGDRHLSKATEVQTLGWTKDGKARVLVFGSVCPLRERTGRIYRVDPETGSKTFERRFVQPEVISKDCMIRDGFRLCPNFWSSEFHSTIQRRVSTGKWKVVTGPLQYRSKDALGFWRYVLASPDKKTLLAQWSGECESPNAFFVPVRGGTPRAVSGERHWWRAPESGARGWSKDGRAIVRLYGGACGIGAHRPGVYLIDPETGRAEFVRRLTRAEGGGTPRGA